MLNVKKLNKKIIEALAKAPALAFVALIKSTTDAAEREHIAAVAAALKIKIE